mmetsp:Transcript_40245/g.52718  ORF Transcript_40245/g.52718 Transcript_40245/m.52718 type:complete len:81 (+) Transcript_40245:126-368(+)
MLPSHRMMHIQRTCDVQKRRVLACRELSSGTRRFKDCSLAALSIGHCLRIGNFLHFASTHGALARGRVSSSVYLAASHDE